MNEEIRRNGAGLYTLALKSGSVRLLKYLLPPEIPYVYLRQHCPESVIQWWETQIRFSKKGPLHSARVRHLTYDLELPTPEFLGALDEFEGGLYLLHSHNPLPATSRRGVVELKSSDPVVSEHMESSFDLPHGGEVCVFATKTRAIIERALTYEEIQSRAF